MNQRLNPHTVAELYTEEQLLAKIATLETAMTSAAQGGYSFDSGQHKQTVSPATSSQSVESLLSVYMKALSIKRGTYNGAQIISGGYAP